ncbi:EcsC family protein [Chachezhania antarctica]|uniref:EcsC family protein n=1 Tax=Chachezhania antarctica TaxID=2340860 RepID=UPI000EB219C5|nr:EcsC family protein [Chachezhania antarctica]
MTQDPHVLTRPPEIDLDSQLDALAVRYRKASGPGIALLNTLGLQAETMIDRLPVPIRDRLSVVTESALTQAMRAAHFSRRAVPDQSRQVNALVAGAMGAAGGFGGLATSMIELPATTTMLLRSIQGVAVKHGFDPASESVQFDCVRVLADGGPLTSDDGADTGFFTTRLSVTGPAMRTLVSRVLPGLSESLGRKLATRTVPVLGAVTGAATNYVYAQYYQDLAHVGFGLRKLALETDMSYDLVVDNFVEKLRGNPRQPL